MKNKLIPFVLESPLPGYGGWGNGYVALPEGHPCFGLDYDQIHEKYDISVHYGLTYSNEADKVYHPKKVQGMWVVGFDTLHSGDDTTRWPDEESVMRHTKELMKQLEAIAEKESV